MVTRQCTRLHGSSWDIKGARHQGTFENVKEGNGSMDIARDIT